ncbi:MAG: NADH-quinone oxidoreductase subunit NuoK [Acidilobaceae archaeon]
MELQAVILATSLSLIAIGVYGLTSTNNLIRQLLSIEVVFNGIILLIVAMATANPTMITLLLIILISVVSGEVIVVMALIISMYRVSRTLTSDALAEEGV